MSYKEFTEKFKKIDVPSKLKVADLVPVVEATPVQKNQDALMRKGKFWDKFKNNLIDLFKEEEDQVIK